MATLREIKRRIESVKSTQQITKAMKMVAAAKLRKSQQQLVQTRPYADKLFNVVCELARMPVNKQHPWFKKRDPQNVLYVLVTADRGLCGSFNSNLIKRAVDEIGEHPGSKKLITIGRKGYDHFRRRDYRIVGKYIDFFNKVTFDDAKKVAASLVEKFERKKVDRIYIIYNEFQSIIRQQIIVKQFLPIEISETDFAEEKPELFEPHPQTILEALAAKALHYSMYRILLESFTAEQGARMTAMETASDNANDMIKSLVLFYNKARQAAITKELNEIVSGAEALRG